MDVAIAPAVAKTAASAAGKLVPGLLREAWRKRAVRRSVRTLRERPGTELDRLVAGLAPADAARLVAYVRLPDFEQFAIQLTGMALERKRPEKYVADLRAGLARSLRLHGVTVGQEMATALFDELWSAVVSTIGAVGQTTTRTPHWARR